MKHLKTLLALLIILQLNSCNKDETDTPEAFYMTAKIDQTDFEAKPETVKVDYYTDDGDFMTITGVTANNYKIFMLVNLQNYTEGTGTYDQNQVRFDFRIITPTVDDFWTTDTPGAGAGTLTILEENDEHLKGTFSFDPFHNYGNISEFNTSILVTNGKFNAKK